MTEIEVVSRFLKYQKYSLTYVLLKKMKKQ